MTIDINSRYYYSTIDYIQLVENSDNTPIVFYEFDSIGTITYRIHVYTEGERLDDIAFQYWGRPKMWWMIPEYNPQLTDFTNITPGTELKIILNV
jgi:hypothetical protein